MRGRTRGSKSVVTNANNRCRRPQGRDEKIQTRDRQLRDFIEQTGTECDEVKSNVKVDTSGRSHLY